MRKFSSYGLISKKLHYYVPREELVEQALSQLVGKDPDEGGHYITVWAPRQCGKSWIMREVLQQLWNSEKFDARAFSFQSAKTIETDQRLLNFFVGKMGDAFSKKFPKITSWEEIAALFRKPFFEKPVILILDEFDALEEDFINKFANEFREMHAQRRMDIQSGSEKNCFLHGLALIGVRSVLGIENVKGSLFNVQRSMHIPNLTYEEVCSMFRWYEEESGQKVEQDVIDRVFYETSGQPGLVSWFGELLTEGFDEYVPDKTRPVRGKDFDYVYMAAIQLLPNNNILNIISKAKQEPYKKFVLEMFRTGEKVLFRFDDPNQNFLYMNGVTDREMSGDKAYIRFSSPFVQKRLFNYFSHEIFPHMGRLSEPFEDISDTVAEKSLNVRNLIRRYEAHLQKNRDWILKDAPRRSDMRIREAVFHFGLYEYIVRFLSSYDTKVWPEFPTGNGKIDLMIRHGGNLYALEVKSWKDDPAYRIALKQAAEYGAELKLDAIWLVVFVEYIPEGYREKYETDYKDAKTGVTVKPVFAATGN